MQLLLNGEATACAPMVAVWGGMVQRVGEKGKGTCSYCSTVRVAAHHGRAPRCRGWVGRGKGACRYCSTVRVGQLAGCSGSGSAVAQGLGGC